jgi:hypothetical protein
VPTECTHTWINYFEKKKKYYKLHRANAVHPPMPEECRGETVRSGRLAVLDWQAELAALAAHTVDMDRRTVLEVAPEFEAEEVAVVEPRGLGVAVVVALSGQPGATAPMLPSLLAVAGLARERERGQGHKPLVLHKERQLLEVAVGEVHIQPPAGESLNTAEAILQCCY